MGLPYSYQPETMYTELADTVWRIPFGEYRLADTVWRVPFGGYRIDRVGLTDTAMKRQPVV